MKTIAFYGKGGIGKSTVLSNVVAALSRRGKKILQIGCDPKHDSTRLILGGFTQATVLEQLNTTGRVSLDSVMLTGYNGVKCIEAGGPEPGVGCAGRGIIQMLNLLQEQGLDTKQFDYVFFDVLGDVVCGGFAVPMREGYADEVYIVTSGEIAALYAANNIAKGIKRFSTKHGKLGGVIGNGRGTRNERETIATFARLIGTEMVTYIPKSELIVQAEFESKTISDLTPDSELAAIFDSIASHIESQKEPTVPKPLSDKELDTFLHDYCYNSLSPNRTPPTNSSLNQVTTTNAAAVSASTQKAEASKNTNNACLSRSSNRPPVQGCSISGAFSAVKKIKDAITIMHSPSGCASASFSGCLSNSSYSNTETRCPPSVLCTNLRETDIIFGGTKKLRATIMDVHAKFPSRSIFIITSCSSGIIGDDVNQVVADLKADGVSVFFIPTDGVMNSGDYYNGMISSYRTIADNLIDNNVCPEDNLVNLIGEQTQVPLGINNYDVLEQLFNKLGIKVNCRFLGETTINQIRNFKKATVSIPFPYDPLVNEVTDYLKTWFSIPILDAPLPIGFEQTAEFTRLLGRSFNKDSEAEKIINDSRKDYEKQLMTLRKDLAGKKALIFSTPHNIDWLLTTLFDLDVKIPKIYATSVFPPRETFSTKFSVPIENNYPEQKIKQAIIEEKPDFVLTSINTSKSVPCDATSAPVLPVVPVYGFNAGLVFAKRLQFKLKYPTIEGWRNDKNIIKSCAA
jgi:nitrogenase iron protein NifH